MNSMDSSDASVTKVAVGESDKNRFSDLKTGLFVFCMTGQSVFYMYEKYSKSMSHHCQIRSNK